MSVPATANWSGVIGNGARFQITPEKRLFVAYFAGGTLGLNPELAAKAIQDKVAKPLGMSLKEAALGIHRVVNVQGKVSPRGGGREGSNEQHDRLALEGIEFDAFGQLDLGRYQWSFDD